MIVNQNCTDLALMNPKHKRTTHNTRSVTVLGLSKLLFHRSESKDDVNGVQDDNTWPAAKWLPHTGLG